MSTIQEIFGDKPLTHSEFTAAADKAGMKLVDLSAGGYVGKEKFDALQTKYDTMSGQLSEANKKLEGIDPDWKTKVADAEKKAQEAVDKIKFDYAISAALANAKARNTTAVKALLNMDGLKLNGDDIVGLKEQLEKIKADNGYLFEGETQPNFGKPTPGAKDNTGGDDKNSKANAALRALFGGKGD